MLIVRKVGVAVVPYLVDGRHPGRWYPGATRLLGVSGPVESSHLRQMLEGRDPRTAADLPLRRRADRRPGWSLVFSAPKSVSLLAAAEPDMALAHVAAVDRVLGYLESRLLLKRADRDGKPLQADGLLAASFDHTTNAAAEPHLHTHVVIANMSRSGPAWGAVEPADWNIDRVALGALFDLELRHQLGERGWPLDWRLRPDGLADVAEVPRAAVRAASAQGRRAAVSGTWAARKGATPQPWAAKAAEAGFVAPSSPTREPRATLPMDDPGLERAVGLRLASRRSDFRRADVIETLASCWPGGAPIEKATGWADRFCDRSVRVQSPTTRPRWATGASRRLDDELVQELTGRPARVQFMGCDAGRTDLLAQAEILAAARAAWEDAGERVAVSAADPVSEWRWAVLTGLAPFRSGDRPDVLVVDRADRRPTADLLRTVRAHPGALVFVEGGTRPRLSNPASHGLAEAGDRIGRAPSGPHRPWGSSMGLDPGSGPLVGRQAADALLYGWRTAGDRSVLVALGIEEMRALNRAVLGSERPERGPGRFQAGDRVVVARSCAGLPPFGSFGTVGERAALDAVALAVDWDGGSRTVSSDPRELAAVDFGYAVSPRVAAGVDRPLRVFGPAAAIDRGRERVVAAIEPAGVGPGRDRTPEAGARVGLSM